MNTDYWDMLDKYDLLQEYENDHVPGQTFEEWLEEGIKCRLLVVDAGGNYYVRL